MLSGNGTIDYDIEAHTLDAHKTSAAHEESITGDLQILLKTVIGHYWYAFRYLLQTK